MNVTRSDYYYHTKNPINSYKEANQKLDVEIKRVYDDSKGRYGSPKITKQLNNEGIKVSQKRNTIMLEVQKQIVQKNIQTF